MRSHKLVALVVGAAFAGATSAQANRREAKLPLFQGPAVDAPMPE